MKTKPTEIFLIILILAVLVFFINPFMAWMPTTIHYMAVGGLIVLVGLFAGLLWHEQPKDEREELHRFIGARFSYTSGVIILTVAIALQSIMHAPDIWLVVTLGAMIIAKLAGHLYARTRL